MKLKDMEGSDLPEYISSINWESPVKTVETACKELGCTERELLLALIEHF